MPTFPELQAMPETAPPRAVTKSNGQVQAGVRMERPPSKPDTAGAAGHFFAGLDSTPLDRPDPDRRDRDRFVAARPRDGDADTHETYRPSFLG